VVALDSSQTRRLAKQDGRTVILEDDGDKMADAIAKAIELGAGAPLSEAEAAQWAVRACKSIHQLGVTRNDAYAIGRIRPALIEALNADSAEVQKAAAMALSVLADASAQRAIVKLAVSADASEEVRIAAFQAGSESAQRFGAQITDEQASDIVNVVIGDGSRELRIAAARMQGSLNLPSEKVKDLILSTGK
jgi:hypothetical protein